MLDLVRGKPGALAPVSAAKVVQRALQTVGSRLAGGVRLELDLEPVPPVAADESGLHQALVNVLLNAIDAAPLGNGRLRISVRQSEEQVQIAIADNGPGIPPELRDRLFQPLVSGNVQRGGTGLGLSIARDHPLARGRDARRRRTSRRRGVHHRAVGRALIDARRRGCCRSRRSAAPFRGLRVQLPDAQRSRGDHHQVRGQQPEQQPASLEEDARRFAPLDRLCVGKQAADPDVKDGARKQAEAECPPRGRAAAAG